MNSLNTMVSVVFKRPIVIGFLSLVMLILTFLNSFNPMLPFIAGLNNVTGASFFENIVSLMQLMMNPSIIMGLLFFLLVFVILGSSIIGVVFSGYMYIINAAIEGKVKYSGDFVNGLKKYFSKIFLMTLKILTTYVILALFFAIACVPAAIFTRTAVTNKPELMIVAVFIDILTVAVLFFGIMFSRAYTLFAYPAIFKGAKQPFHIAKKFADRHFWQIAFKLFCFDIVFIIFLYAIHQISNQLINILLNWLFITVFYTTVITFIFNYFKENFGVSTITKTK